MWANILDAIRRHGLLNTLLLIPKNLIHATRWHLDRSFDRRHGTDTSGVIPLERLSISSNNVMHGIYYEPTSTRLFRIMMKRLGIRHHDYVFIDLGSGKGRTLLLAAEFPFSKIVGVEFSEQLHRTAEHNIQVFHSERQRCRDIASVHMDVLDFPFPEQDLVIYLYNPFKKEMMARILGKLKSSLEQHPRKLIIIYFNAISGALFENQPFLPYRTEIRLPYDWTRHHQRRTLVYSNHSCIR